MKPSAALRNDVKVHTSPRSAGQSDNGERAGKPQMPLHVVARRAAETAGGENAAGLKVFIWTDSSVDRKLFSAFLTAKAITHEFVQDPEIFVDCMKAWPKVLALVRVNSEGSRILKDIKADPECADRPLLVYSSQALKLGDWLGGPAGSVLEVAYPFTMFALTKTIEGYR
jgi:hypothetical protein